MNAQTEYDPNVYVVRATTRNDFESLFGPLSRDAAESVVQDLARTDRFCKVRLERASHIPGHETDDSEPGLRYMADEERTRMLAREEARQVLSDAARKATRQ